MTTDIKELVKRLRDTDGGFESEIADALEALAGEVERWKKNHEALQDKIGCMKSCGCAYDAAGDICGHHSPKLIAAEAERDRLAGEVEKWKQAAAWDKAAASDFLGRAEEAEAERDRLKAVLKPRLNAKAVEGLQEILEAMEAMDEREAPFLKTLLDWHEATRKALGDAS